RGAQRGTERSREYSAQPQEGTQRHGAQLQGKSTSAPRPEAHQLTGRLVAHRDGYGFVVPDTPRKDLQGDLFIGRDAMGDAMHGDYVLASIERREGGRLAAGPGRAEGRILRVLNRAHATVVGVFQYGQR